MRLTWTLALALLATTPALAQDTAPDPRALLEEARFAETHARDFDRAQSLLERARAAAEGSPLMKEVDAALARLKERRSAAKARFDAQIATLLRQLARSPNDTSTKPYNDLLVYGEAAVPQLAAALHGEPVGADPAGIEAAVRLSPGIVAQLLAAIRGDAAEAALTRALSSADPLTRREVLQALKHNDWGQALSPKLKAALISCAEEPRPETQELAVLILASAASPEDIPMLRRFASAGCEPALWELGKLQPQALLTLLDDPSFAQRHGLATLHALSHSMLSDLNILKGALESLPRWLPKLEAQGREEAFATISSTLRDFNKSLSSTPTTDLNAAKAQLLALALKHPPQRPSELHFLWGRIACDDAFEVLLDTFEAETSGPASLALRAAFQQLNDYAPQRELARRALLALNRLFADPHELLTHSGYARIFIERMRDEDLADIPESESETILKKLWTYRDHRGIPEIIARLAPASTLARAFPREGEQAPDSELPATLALRELGLRRAVAFVSSLPKGDSRIAAEQALNEHFIDGLSADDRALLLTALTDRRRLEFLLNHALWLPNPRQYLPEILAALRQGEAPEAWRRNLAEVASSTLPPKLEPGDPLLIGELFMTGLGNGALDIFYGQDKRFRLSEHEATPAQLDILFAALEHPETRAHAAVGLGQVQLAAPAETRARLDAACASFDAATLRELAPLLLHTARGSPRHDIVSPELAARAYLAFTPHLDDAKPLPQHARSLPWIASDGASLLCAQALLRNALVNELGGQHPSGPRHAASLAERLRNVPEGDPASLLEGLILEVASLSAAQRERCSSVFEQAAHGLELPALLALAQRCWTHPTARELVFEMLSQHPQPESTAFFCKRVDELPREAWPKLAKLIGERLYEPGLELIEAWLEDTTPLLRTSARVALAAFRQQREARAELAAWRRPIPTEAEAAAQLLKQLEADDPDVTLGAVKALGALRSKPALPRLVSLLEGASPELKAAIHEAIADIGKDPSPPKD